MHGLEENPKKGKEIGNINKVVIKEIRYNKFRFYFLTDGYKIKFFKIEDLRNIIIKFVRMSKKRSRKSNRRHKGCSKKTGGRRILAKLF